MLFFVFFLLLFIDCYVGGIVEGTQIVIGFEQVVVVVKQISPKCIYLFDHLWRAIFRMCKFIEQVKAFQLYEDSFGFQVLAS